jgi:hemolysin activation/secretion protein
MRITKIIIFLLLFASCAFAQEPPGQEVGAEAKRFKQEAEQRRQELEEKKKPAAEIAIEEEKEKPAAPAISFVLQAVRISGATVFKQEDFQAAYAPYISKEVTLKDIELIIEQIKAIYKAKGYLTTTAYLPEQEIREGVVEIRVMEGKMGRLIIEGNRWFSQSFIAKYFHTLKGEILNIKKLQQDILRLNQNPDLRVGVVISAGEEPQTSDVTLKITDKFPWHVGIGADNRGTRLSGKYRSNAYVRSTNVSGEGDALFISSLYSSRSLGELISYTLPIDTYGAKFHLDASYFKTQLGKEFKPFDITGASQIYSPYFTWELALEEDYEVYLETGMDIKITKKKMGRQVTTDEHLRLPYFAFDVKLLDAWGGSTTFSPCFTFGTEGFLGASSRNHPSASRAPPRTSPISMSLITTLLTVNN